MYAALIFCVRGCFVHILYHYMKEADERLQERKVEQAAMKYQKLDGQNNNRDGGHDNEKGGNGGANTMQ